MGHEVSAKAPEQAKRPRLSGNRITYRSALWREIKQGPDGVETAGELARIVAGTILEKYELMPDLLQGFARRGLYEDLMEILSPPEDA